MDAAWLRTAGGARPEPAADEGLAAAPGPPLPGSFAALAGGLRGPVNFQMGGSYSRDSQAEVRTFCVPCTSMPTRVCSEDARICGNIPNVESTQPAARRRLLDPHTWRPSGFD